MSVRHKVLKPWTLEASASANTLQVFLGGVCNSSFFFNNSSPFHKGGTSILFLHSHFSVGKKSDFKAAVELQLWQNNCVGCAEG